MKLVLIRGLPWSGKSTKAQSMEGFTHIEADMFFMDNGEYKYDSNKIKEAHLWCQNETKKQLLNGNNVVVSNTFTRYFEMASYFKMARELNVEIQVIETFGKFQNVHGVPDEVINRMRERWEPFLGVNK